MYFLAQHHDDIEAIVKHIIKTTWYERQVLECINRIIGPSTIPQDIHFYLLKLIE